MPFAQNEKDMRTTTSMIYLMDLLGVDEMDMSTGGMVVSTEI